MPKAYALRAFRLKRGMTQLQLTEASGVAQPTISKYENEDEFVDPPWSIVQQLAKALRIDPLRLRFGKPKPPGPRRRRRRRAVPPPAEVAL